MGELSGKNIISHSKNKQIEQFLYPPKKVLHKMGFLTDQEGIMHRYLKEQKNWESHLKNTCDFIRNSFEANKDKSIAVLGSGWMLDIPAEYLLENFKQVVFYDLNHPSQVLRKYRDYNNALFVETDLSGGLIEEVNRVCSPWRKYNPESLVQVYANRLFEFPYPADYVFSVNLLNQLDILIIDYLKKFYRLDIVLLNKLRAQIQENHLKILHEGKSSIITDYEEVHLTSRASIEGSIPLIHCKMPGGCKSKKWIWQFDTLKSYDPRWNTNLKVIAIKI